MRIHNIIKIIYIYKMKGNESKLTSAIKNIILANKNVEVIKEVL